MGKKSASQTGDRRSVSRAAWFLLLLAAVFPLAFRQVTVSDAWWHVALGKWLVEMRTLPDLSRFYFTPVDAGSLASELRWEWLGDILLYLAYAAAGVPGIQWLVVACAFAGLIFLADRFRQRGGPWLLLLLGAVCLGTYQLQLARNSAYSLALYPLREAGLSGWFFCAAHSRGLGGLQRGFGERFTRCPSQSTRRNHCHHPNHIASVGGYFSEFRGLEPASHRHWHGGFCAQNRIGQFR